MGISNINIVVPKNIKNSFESTYSKTSVSDISNHTITSCKIDEVELNIPGIADSPSDDDIKISGEGTVDYDANIKQIEEDKKPAVELKESANNCLKDIESILKMADQDGNLVSLYNGYLKYTSNTNYNPYDSYSAYAKNELPNIKAKLDAFISSNSNYSSYDELMKAKGDYERIISECDVSIEYFDRQIKWQNYYKISDLADFKKFQCEGMLGEKEYHDNISNTTFRGEEYTKLLSIKSIGDYDSQLKELFGDNYKDALAEYGLDLDFDYLKMYNYIYQIKGEEAAKEYYAFAEENINSLAGLVGALSAIKDLKTDELPDFITNYFKVHAKGMGDGVVGSLEGLAAWFSNSSVRDASSYEAMWYAMMLESNKYGPGQVFNYQVGQGTGQMLPVMALGWLCPVGATVTLGTTEIATAKILATSYLLLSAGGRDYKEQLINGKSRSEAFIHGILSGSCEVATENLLGGLPFLSDTEVVDVKTLLNAMRREGFQEVAQDLISDLLLGDGIPTFNSPEESREWWRGKLKESFTTFLVAGVSAGELQSTSLASSTVNINYIQDQIKIGNTSEMELVEIIKNSGLDGIENLSNEEIIKKYNNYLASYCRANQSLIEQNNIKALNDTYLKTKEAVGGEDILTSDEEYLEDTQDLDVTPVINPFIPPLDDSDNHIGDTLDLGKPPIGQAQIEGIIGLKDGVVEEPPQMESIPEFNSRKLLEEINSLVNPNMDIFQKSRLLYIELNKRLSYNVDYISNDPNVRNSIYNTELSFENLDNKYVICKGWSELYRQLLIENGFSPDSIRLVNSGKHVWVEIDVGNGNIIIADATENIVHSNDLSNCKIGAVTNGFVYVNNHYSGTRLSDFESYDIVRNGWKQWNGVDNTIGYSIDGRYFGELSDIAKDLFGNNSYDQYSFNSRVADFANIKPRTSLDGLEAYAYYNMVKRILFNPVDLSKIKVDAKANKVGSFYEGIALVKIKTDSGNVYITQSAATGKHIFTDEYKYNEFINSLQLKDLR